MLYSSFNKTNTWKYWTLLWRHPRAALASIYVVSSGLPWLCTAEGPAILSPTYRRLCRHCLYRGPSSHCGTDSWTRNPLNVRCGVKGWLIHRFCYPKQESSELSEQRGCKQSKGKQQLSTLRTTFFQRKKSYPVWNHDTLQSRRVLYPLSYQGNSAGKARIYNWIQCNTKQRQASKTLCYATETCHSVCRSRPGYT